MIPQEKKFFRPARLSQTAAKAAVALRTAALLGVGTVVCGTAFAADVPPITVVSPDVAHYAVVAPDNHVEVRVWSGNAAQTVRLEPQKAPITALTFSADGGALAVGSDDRMIRVWDTRTGKRLSELRLPREPKVKQESHIGALAFNHLGTSLAASDNGYGWLIVYNGQDVAHLGYGSAVIAGVNLLSLASDPRGGWVGGDSGGRFRFYNAALRQVGITGSLIAGAIRSLAVSPDDRFIASGGDDSEIKLWHYGGMDTVVSENAARFTLSDRYAATSSVTNVVFRPDGAVVLAVDRSGQFQNWTFGSGAGLVTATPAPTAAVDPSTTVPTAPVEAPPVTAPVPPAVVKVAPPVKAPVKLPPKTTKTAARPKTVPTKVATAITTKRPLPPPVIAPPPIIALHPTVTLEHKLIGHSEYVNAVAFSPDGQLLASGSRDKTVRLWGVADGLQKALLGKHTSFVSAVAFSPDGKRIASGGWDNKILFWNPANGSALPIDPNVEKHTSYVLSLDWNADGTRLASGSNDLTARVFDMRSGEAAHSVGPLGNAVAAVAFSPDGTRLAGGCLDGRVYIWDARTLKPLQTMIARPARPVYCLAWLDNETLVTSGKAGIIRSWNARTGKAGPFFMANGSDVYGLARNPTEPLLATGGADKMITFWSVADIKAGHATIKPLTQAKGHTDTVRTLAFSHDGKTLASGGWDYNILLWSVSLPEGK